MSARARTEISISWVIIFGCATVLLIIIESLLWNAAYSRGYAASDKAQAIEAATMAKAVSAILSKNIQYEVTDAVQDAVRATVDNALAEASANLDDELQDSVERLVRTRVDRLFEQGSN